MKVSSLTYSSFRRGTANTVCSTFLPNIISTPRAPILSDSFLHWNLSVLFLCVFFFLVDLFDNSLFLQKYINKSADEKKEHTNDLHWLTSTARYSTAHKCASSIIRMPQHWKLRLWTFHWRLHELLSRLCHLSDRRRRKTKPMHSVVLIAFLFFLPYLSSSISPFIFPFQIIFCHVVIKVTYVVFFLFSCSCSSSFNKMLPTFRVLAKKGVASMNRLASKQAASSLSTSTTDWAAPKQVVPLAASARAHRGTRDSYSNLI